MTAAAAGALAGVRVLDLTRMLSGPFCGMLLADQGADVIKVEPFEGDTARASTNGPYLPDDTLKAFGGYFQSTNRNKRGLAIDLKHPAGREAFLRLVDGASVVLENFRVGVMDRLGVGYEVLHARNPRLVYAAIRGFGDPRTGASPYADWPAYDVIAQAMGGIMGITGAGPGQPMKVGPGVGDIVPAMLAAFGIVAAVRHAERTGEGQFVDVAMYDGILALCERIVFQHSYLGQVPGPEGTGHPFICPFGLYPCADGWVAIACPTDKFWRVLCRVMGRPDWGGDPRFASRAARAGQRGEIESTLSAWTGTRTKAELARLLGGQVPFGPVNTVADIFADPHARARGMLAEVEHPGAAGKAVIAGTPVRMTATPGGVRRRAPILGEHTAEVLLECGLDQAEVATLQATGAVRQWQPAPVPQGGTRDDD